MPALRRRDDHECKRESEHRRQHCEPAHCSSFFRGRGSYQERLGVKEKGEYYSGFEAMRAFFRRSVPPKWSVNSTRVTPVRASPFYSADRVSLVN